MTAVVAPPPSPSHCLRAVRLALFVIAGYAMVLPAVADNIQYVMQEPEMKYDGDPCELRNGTAGICRPADDCSWLRLNPAVRKDLVTCSFNMSLPIVCCMHEVSNRRPIFPAKRISETQCEQFPTSTNLTFHIFNGTTAQFGEFPHMAALGYREDNETKFRCGASLISPRFLLTAAHCISQDLAYARLGVLELQPERVVDEPLDIEIRNSTKHPDFNQRTYANDIALIELEHEVTAEWPFVHPACLHMNASGDALSSDVVLSVQGWGQDSLYALMQEGRLLKANVTLVERSACATMLPPSRRTLGAPQAHQLCALGRNSRNETIADTCGGDSGGPLELIVDRRHYLVGITSFGFECGSPIPGIYTDISYYLDWIEAIVWPPN